MLDSVIITRNVTFDETRFFTEKKDEMITKAEAEKIVRAITINGYEHREQEKLQESVEHESTVNTSLPTEQELGGATGAPEDQQDGQPVDQTDANGATTRAASLAGELRRDRVEQKD